MPGNHIIEVELAYPYNNPYPGLNDLSNNGVGTNYVVVKIIDVTKMNSVEGIYLEATKNFPIVWPPAEIYRENIAIFGKPTAELLAEAVDMIDEGQETSLNTAKRRLENILSREPKNSTVFVELARIAMKSNWGTEGLHQAEQLITTALIHDPENTNAMVLQGYVFAHQKKFEAAEKSLSKAAAKGTNNLWLWVNWGELLLMKGNVEPAIDKYYKALQGVRPKNTNDNARKAAYYALINLDPKYLPTEKIESLHKSRISEFPEHPCFKAEYAKFKVLMQTDVQSAKSIALDSIASGCRHDIAKRALGLGLYYSWVNLSGEQAVNELTQARVNFPEGPNLLLELARVDSGIPVIKKLMANGLNIDQINNRQLTALALALREGEHGVAKRLILLGARLSISTSEGDFPLGFIPLMNRDVEGVKLMRAHGVDYTKLKWRGQTATEVAKGIGDLNLLNALGLQRSKKSI